MYLSLSPLLSPTLSITNHTIPARLKTNSKDLKDTIAKSEEPPLLVGFLANDDPAGKLKSDRVAHSETF
jgi:hypothetical protein